MKAISILVVFELYYLYFHNNTLCGSFYNVNVSWYKFIVITIEYLKLRFNFIRNKSRLYAFAWVLFSANGSQLIILWNEWSWRIRREEQLMSIKESLVAIKLKWLWGKRKNRWTTLLPKFSHIDKSACKSVFGKLTIAHNYSLKRVSFYDC